MPDFNPSPAGGPDGALAWYNHSLAKVLGLNPADPTLPADLLSELNTAAQRKALAAVIDRRFKRHVDEVTGAVTMERVGDPLILIEPDEDSDPVIGGLATTYLGAAQAAIAGIDPAQCIPGACAEQVAGLIRQIQANIATVTAEAPGRRNRYQMLLHLHELTDPNDGLLLRLGQVFGEGRNVPVDSVGWERAIGAIGLAKGALASFEMAIVELRAGDDEPSLSEIAEIVGGCGAHVSTHARNVRTALRGAGIGGCELRGVELTIPTVQLSCEAFEMVTLDQALQVLETEPARWAALIASGRRSGFDNVKRSAEAMLPMVNAINPTSILKTLGILAESEAQSEPREAFALALSYQLDRLRGYALSVLRMILREAPLQAPAAQANDHK
ncbi:MAG TPA: hypothetical protein VGB57_07455 [Allosphingosinicella sp.]